MWQRVRTVHLLTGSNTWVCVCVYRDAFLGEVVLAFRVRMWPFFVCMSLCVCVCVCEHVSCFWKDVHLVPVGQWEWAWLVCTSNQPSLSHVCVCLPSVESSFVLSVDRAYVALSIESVAQTGRHTALYWHDLCIINWYRCHTNTMTL